jgi:hypothetical protein
MTILSLEDSKALYDAGIKIETKNVWLICEERPWQSHKAGVGSISELYWRGPKIPAPDLEELLEYARKKTRECGLRMNIIFSAECDDIDIFVEEIYLTKAHAEGEELIKLLVEILLKLKEEGYDI